MAFRDINPAPVNSLAWGDMVGNVGANVLEGQERGMRNALLMDQVGRDVATRNAFSEYLAAPPEARGNLLAQLGGLSPQAAVNALSIDQAQAQLAQQQRREQALKEYTDAQFVLKSKNPARMLRLMDADGSFAKQLTDAGVIDPTDGWDDDEARLLAQWAVDTTAPIAGIGQDRTSTDVATMRELRFELTPEGFAEYNAAKGAPADGDSMYQGILAQLEVLKRQEELNRRAQEGARADADRTEADRVKKAQAVSSTSRVIDAWDALNVIEQSAIARPGFGGSARSTVAGALSLIGLEDPAVSTAAEQFNDIATISGAELIKQLGLDPTDTKFRAITQASLSLDKATDTNRVQLQRLARAAIEEADAGRLPLADDMRSRLGRMAQWRPSAQAPLVDVPGAVRSVNERIVELGNGVKLEFLD